MSAESDPTDSRQARITLADPGCALEPIEWSAFEKFLCAIEVGAEGMTSLRRALAMVRLNSADRAIVPLKRWERSRRNGLSVVNVQG